MKGVVIEKTIKEEMNKVKINFDDNYNSSIVNILYYIFQFFNFEHVPEQPIDNNSIVLCIAKPHFTPLNGPFSDVSNGGKPKATKMPLPLSSTMKRHIVP